MNDQTRPPDPDRIPKEGASLPPLLGEPERQDIHQIHQALLQHEQLEPKDGFEPTPWWVWAVSVVVIFSMGFYLGRYGGSFSADPHELYHRPAPVTAEAAAGVPAVDGEAVYSTVCLPCHQAGGVGVPGRYPPLAGSEWVAGDPGKAIRIVLHGLTGPIQVKGNTYRLDMPPLGSLLSDAEVAAVLTYVRSNWGNDADPVDVAAVGRIREASTGQGYWTAETLAASGGSSR